MIKRGKLAAYCQGDAAASHAFVELLQRCLPQRAKLQLPSNESTTTLPARLHFPSFLFSDLLLDYVSTGNISSKDRNS
eukprot:5101207-Amphidinium_carterae.1